MSPPSPAWGFSPQTPIRGAATPLGARELVRGRDRAPDVGRGQAGGHVAQRDVPGDERHPQPPAAERHRGLAAPAGGEELGLPGERPADRGESLLAHGAGDDAGEFARLAQGRRPLERGPGDERALAVRRARSWPRSPPADRNPARPCGQRRQPAGWADHGHGALPGSFRGEPGRDDLGADSGRVPAGDGDSLAQWARPAQSSASSPSGTPERRARAMPRVARRDELEEAARLRGA